jgi:hypothetical protein
VEEAWEEIPEKTIFELLESFSRRCGAVIDAKGEIVRVPKKRAAGVV